MGLRKTEILVVFGFALLGLLWSFLIVPAMTSQSWFLTLNPVPAYFAYNTGWILLVSMVFGGLVSHFAMSEGNIGHVFRVGIASWITFSFLFDMWQPPLYLSYGGLVLIPLGTPALENTAVDAMAAYVWHVILGNYVHIILFDGISLWFVLTYGATSAIAILVMVLILRPRQVIELLSSGVG